jgi:hypothetical protein
LVDFSVNKEGEEGHINHPQQQKKRFFLETWNPPIQPK